MYELRCLVRAFLSEALDPTDPTTWARFVPTGSMVELWHVVNDAASLVDILGKEGLLPGAQSDASSAEDGSPAVILARKLQDNDAAPAVLCLRVPTPTFCGTPCRFAHVAFSICLVGDAVDACHVSMLAPFEYKEPL